AANLTRQLLAIGRKQILQPVPLNLNDIVNDMNKMLRRLIGENIELSARLDPKVKTIKADPGQIEQVLVNLVVNARDAMPTGGSLTIETRDAELDEGLETSTSQGERTQYVAIIVADTGTGMPPEIRDHIFEPFFTTKVEGALLRAGGYTVIEAADGSEALRLCADPSVTVDLVLTDMVMPVMGGRELARSVRERYPGTPMVFMSGYSRTAITDEDVIAN